MKEAREFLFEKYSKNLEEILNLNPLIKRPPYSIYMCPLCRLIFSEKSLDQSFKNPLTLEHIPPESVGGKEFVLTCKNCNNNHGSKFDSHLGEKLRIRKVLTSKQGTLNSKVKFTIGEDIKSNGIIYLDESGKFNFLLEEKRTNPKYHKDIIKMVSGNMGNVKLNYSLNTYNEIKSNISILRSAYLKAFKELGYAFMLNSNNEEIRKRIVENPVSCSPVKGVFMTTENNFVQGLSIITNPQTLQGYLVGLKIIKDGVEELYNVLLPGGNFMSRSLNEEFERMKTSNSPDLSSFQITLLDGEDFIIGENKLFALEYWGENFVFQKGEVK